MDISFLWFSLYLFSQKKYFKEFTFKNGFIRDSI